MCAYEGKMWTWGHLLSDTGKALLTSQMCSGHFDFLKNSTSWGNTKAVGWNQTMAIICFKRIWSEAKSTEK